MFQIQVYDLADEKPEEVLHQFLGHLEKLKEDGDETATHVRTHLRIIVSFFLRCFFLEYSLCQLLRHIASNTFVN